MLYCKSIDLAYNELAKGHVTDGEDCWLDHYGIGLHLVDLVDDVVDVADEVLDWLENPSCDCESYSCELPIIFSMPRNTYATDSADPPPPSESLNIRRG